MDKENIGNTQAPLVSALGGFFLTLFSQGFLSSGVFAQAAPAPLILPRVEVTGSSVPRIDGEAALPVMVIRREEINRSGATSTAELLQRLPAMQLGVSDAFAAGPGSYGFTGASLRGMGEARTLVLLNGLRLAQFGGQTLNGTSAAVDLSAIPLSSIERVEVLTDGASSIYGADAIAGVVNIITRRNAKVADVSVGLSAPRGGGQERRLNVSKGWGDLAVDGRNLTLAMSAESREALYANARPYARSGVAEFSHNGQRYQVVQAALSSIPANALNDAGNVISPSFLSTGRCPARHIATPGATAGSTVCRYDFVGDLVMLPERDRRSLWSSYTQQITPFHTVRVDALLSRAESRFQLAPVPGAVFIPAGSALHNQYLRPYGVTQDSFALYRTTDLGTRSGRETSDLGHLALSAQGPWGEWDYKGSFAYSRSQARSRITGYAGALALNQLLDSGVINPFVEPGQQTPQAQAALRNVAYEGDWDGGVSKLHTLALSASRQLANWTHGPVVLGLGVSHHRESYESRPSLFAQGRLADPVTGELADPAAGRPGDVRFGDSFTTQPYSASRQVSSGFAELVLPVRKTLELTGSARLDHYSDAGTTSTAKGGARWQPSSGLLFRGSMGTGFRAPTLPQTKATVQSYGSTSSPYDCSADLQQMAQNLQARCRPDGSQYDVLAGGNASLKPERSRQLSLGFRIEPSQSFGMGADFWHVGLRDVISQLPQEEAFANPQQYPGSFSTVRDTSSGINYLALQSLNQNLGKEYRSGLDMDAQSRWKALGGQWLSQLRISHVFRQAQQLAPGGMYYSSLGNNAELGEVTFRWRGRWATTLQQAQWRHTLVLNFKSGYRDRSVQAQLLDASGQPTGQYGFVRVKVPWSSTVDWQSAWLFNKTWSLNVGLINVFNQQPPFVPSNGGVNRGQNFGYDDRYSDPRGRVFYANLNHRF
ncbi:MAG: TonB-dependent receptor [Rhizobacter sp.]